MERILTDAGWYGFLWQFTKNNRQGSRGHGQSSWVARNCDSVASQLKLLQQLRLWTTGILWWLKSVTKQQSTTHGSGHQQSNISNNNSSDDEKQQSTTWGSGHQQSNSGSNNNSSNEENSTEMKIKTTINQMRWQQVAHTMAGPYQQQYQQRQQKETQTRGEGDYGRMAMVW